MVCSGALPSFPPMPGLSLMLAFFAVPVPSFHSLYGSLSPDTVRLHLPADLCATAPTCSPAARWLLPLTTCPALPCPCSDLLASLTPLSQVSLAIPGPPQLSGLPLPEFLSLGCSLVLALVQLETSCLVFATLPDCFPAFSPVTLQPLPEVQHVSYLLRSLQ